jgi:sugar lactone lactonase YvrE
MKNRNLRSLVIAGVLLFFPFGSYAETAGDAGKGDVRITTHEISYGKGKEDIGAYNRGEGAAMGPRSFTVDIMGNVYICDTVNERIQIYSPSGEYLSTISLAEGTVADDIVVDSAGSVYVYDDSIGLLSQYDRNSHGLQTADLPLLPLQKQEGLWRRARVD